MARHREPGAKGPGGGKTGNDDPRHPGSQDPRLFNERGERRHGIPGVLTPQEILQLLNSEFKCRLGKDDSRNRWRLVQIDDAERIAVFADPDDTRSDSAILADIEMGRVYGPASETGTYLLGDKDSRQGYAVGYKVPISGTTIDVLRSELPEEKARHAEQERAAREQAARLSEEPAWGGRPPVPMGPGNAETGEFTRLELSQRFGTGARPTWDDGTPIGSVSPAPDRSRFQAPHARAERPLDDSEGPRRVDMPAIDADVRDRLAASRSARSGEDTGRFTRKPAPAVEQGTPPAFVLPPAPARTERIIPPPPELPSAPAAEPRRAAASIEPPRPAAPEPRWQLPAESERTVVDPAYVDDSSWRAPAQEAPTGPPARVRERQPLRPPTGRGIPDPSASSPWTIEDLAEEPTDPRGIKPVTASGAAAPNERAPFSRPDSGAPRFPELDRRTGEPERPDRRFGDPSDLFAAETELMPARRPEPGDPGFGEAETLPTPRPEATPAPLPPERPFGEGIGSLTPEQEEALATMRQAAQRAPRQPVTPTLPTAPKKKGFFGRMLGALMDAADPSNPDKK